MKTVSLVTALMVLAAGAIDAQSPATAAAVAAAAAPLPIHHVAIATRAIARGVVLSADDFAVRDTTLRDFVSRGASSDSNMVAAGWTTRRAIQSGEVLRQPAVEPPSVVNANSPVEIEFGDHNITLTMRGVAARNGAVGERVPVRTDQGKRVEATVVAAGRVRIN